MPAEAPATGNNSPPTGFSLPFTAVVYTIITFNNAVGQSSNSNPATTITVASLVPGNPGGNFFNATWLTTPGTANVFQGYNSNCSGVNVPLTDAGNTLSTPAQACGGAGGSVPAGSTLTTALIYF